MSHEQYSSVPDELKRRRQWVGWKQTSDADPAKKLRKVPINPFTGKPASTTDLMSWGGFDEAIAAVEQHNLAGIGFVFSSGDPYVGIDLDDALDHETAARLGIGLVKARAQTTVSRFANVAYVEISPSGTGLHIVTRGKLPGPGGKRSVEERGKVVGAVEMYDRERFFTVTGLTL